MTQSTTTWVSTTMFLRPVCFRPCCSCLLVSTSCGSLSACGFWMMDLVCFPRILSKGLSQNVDMRASVCVCVVLCCIIWLVQLREFLPSIESFLFTYFLPTVPLLYIALPSVLVVVFASPTRSIPSWPWTFFTFSKISFVRNCKYKIITNDTPRKNIIH